MSSPGSSSDAETVETTELVITTEGVPLQAGKPYLVKVISSGFIHARLLDDSGSVRLADTDVILTVPSGDVTLRTDAEGVFGHAEEVPLGDYAIKVGEHETSVAAVRNREQIHEQRVPGLSLGHLKLRIVNRADGTPMASVAVTASGPAELSGNTDDEGQVDLGVAPAGTYKVKVGEHEEDVASSSGDDEYVKVAIGEAPEPPDDPGWAPPGDTET